MNPQDTDPLRDRDTDREPERRRRRKPSADEIMAMPDDVFAGYMERTGLAVQVRSALRRLDEPYPGWHRPPPWYRRIPRSLAAWWRSR